MVAAGSATPLFALDALVLDSETTDVDPRKASIVEIALQPLTGGRLDTDAAVRSLVRPGKTHPAGGHPHPRHRRRGGGGCADVRGGLVHGVVADRRRNHHRSFDRLRPCRHRARMRARRHRLAPPARRGHDIGRGISPTNAVEIKRLSRQDRARLRGALKAVSHLDQLTRDLLFAA
jgi:hypothetical protein